MRCKKHISDQSSVVGVCASCLRERLFALVEAQTQAQAQAALAHSLSSDGSRKSDPQPPPLQPPPLVFPRSVSPYISRRKSDYSPWNQHPHPHRHRHHRNGFSDLRFFSTPQVGPTTAHDGDASSAVASFAATSKKKRGKFSLFSSMFRSRSDKLESEPRSSNGSLPWSSSSPPKWFSSVIPRYNRKKQPPPPSRVDALDYDLPSSVRPPYRDRGMSPDYEVHYEDSEGSPWASGYSTEAWRTPARGPESGKRRGRPSHMRNVSGLAFCLSPLVRASPGRQRNQKSMPPDSVFSGEIRVSGKPHLSAAASSCANRSRKLVDFGRSYHQH